MKLDIDSQIVWRFAVQVVNDKTKHTFDARTDMVWDEFAERAYSHFDKPHNNVRLGYRVSGDTSAMSQLTCANDWEHALDRVKERVIAARTRAVGMELKDMVSGRLFEMEKKKLTVIPG